MLRISEMRALLGGAVVLTLAGCAAPGLPPAGPGPGEVDVGYGKKAEEEVTGAVTSLKEQPIPPGPVRLEELLRGQAAGVEVISNRDGTYRLRIRGLNTLQSSPLAEDPLVILDGVPIAPGTLHNSLGGLTRDDIRQVDVLKDVASTAVYGTRGANGVILIATHRR